MWTEHIVIWDEVDWAVRVRLKYRTFLISNGTVNVPNEPTDADNEPMEFKTTLVVVNSSSGMSILSKGNSVPTTHISVLLECSMPAQIDICVLNTWPFSIIAAENDTVIRLSAYFCEIFEFVTVPRSISTWSNFLNKYL